MPQCGWGPAPGSVRLAGTSQGGRCDVMGWGPPGGTSIHVMFVGVLEAFAMLLRIAHIQHRSVFIRLLPAGLLSELTFWKVTRASSRSPAFPWRSTSPPSHRRGPVGPCFQSRAQMLPFNQAHSQAHLDLCLGSAICLQSSNPPFFSPSSGACPNHLWVTGLVCLLQRLSKRICNWNIKG